MSAFLLLFLLLILQFSISKSVGILFCDNVQRSVEKNKIIPRAQKHVQFSYWIADVFRRFFSAFLHSLCVKKKN